MTERSTPPSEGSATVAARGPAPPGLTETGKLRILTAREIEAARSETARTQEALKESEARFRTLFESSPDGIFITDPDTLEILDCNAQACEMNGYSREELVGRSINLLHPEEVRAQTTGGRRGARGSSSSCGRGASSRRVGPRSQGRDDVPDGDVDVPARARGRDVVMGIDRDISERRRAEEELARTEHLEELVASRTAELAVERTGPRRPTG
jgi:PAS domain S-box